MARVSAARRDVGWDLLAVLILDPYSSVDIATSEGPVNLSWPAIMKTIQEDPQDFYKMGGWTFLTGDGSDDEDSESSAESEFAASDEGVSESEADSESDGTSCMALRLQVPTADIRLHLQRTISTMMPVTTKTLVVTTMTMRDLIGMSWKTRRREVSLIQNTAIRQVTDPMSNGR